MAKRYRVLVISNHAVEASRRSLYRALVHQSDLEVHLLVPTAWREAGDTVQCEDEPDEGLTVHRTGVLFAHRQHRVFYTNLFNVVRGIHPHLIYLDAEPENYAAVQALIARKLSLPTPRLCLISSRLRDFGKIGFPYRFSFAHRMCDAMVKRIGADLIIYRPKSAAGFVSAYASATVYLPHYVDCSVFRSSRLKSNARKKAVTIGFLGRLVEAKGVQLLIETLPHLPTDVNLVMVGKGPLLESLQALAAKLHVDGRTTFLPPIRHDDVPRFMNQLDVLVLPSVDTKYWSEQFGRVLIEAMACEVPVVASDSGGIAEVVGEAGILFRAGSMQDLTEKLSSVVSNEFLRSELAQKGRSRALEMFDVPVVASRLAAAIRDTIEHNG